MFMYVYVHIYVFCLYAYVSSSFAQVLEIPESTSILISHYQGLKNFEDHNILCKLL